MNKSTKEYWTIFITVLLAYSVGNFYDNSISFVYPNLSPGVLALGSFMIAGVLLFFLIIIINSRKG